MKLYLDTKSERWGLIAKFKLHGVRFNFMLVNPLYLLRVPRRLHWWINICPPRVWDFKKTERNYSGHVIGFFYDIWVPLEEMSEA